MLAAIYTQALFIVADVGYLRGAGVILAFVRTFLTRKRFVAFRMGWVEALCTVEPVLLLVVTYHVQSGAVPESGASLGRIGAAILGAALSLGGAGLLVWSFLSWRGLFAGHGVLADHKLVTRGAYGFVRHPVYLAALLVWLGLAVGYLSGTAFAVTALYVIPIYLLYIRSEEEMMLETFGDAYREYRRVVPMLVPGGWPATA
ncbi:MAG TPA: isoprenylcysteine carboxylmethyltransferase family protein [Verrucomicrobiae bacterium]|nr:isoprenylcysteine carboxylmethyltransferase family protein [Verrucomicrobiae bacterium]